MRLCSRIIAFVALVSSVSAVSWGFEDATVSISTKGSGVGSGQKQKFSSSKPLSKPLKLGPHDTLKILLTTKEDETPKKAHQVFLNVVEPATNLETSFPLQVKDNGKARLELSSQDIPAQLLHSKTQLKASLFVASFGTTDPIAAHVFDLAIAHDPASPFPSAPATERYSSKPEIHHIFRGAPRNPPIIITLAFSAAVLAALPAMLIVWTSLGGNMNHLSKAFGNAPVPHGLYFGSIVAMEAVFFLYYTHWKLYQLLPAAFGVGLVIFLSGIRALTEVQQRRLDGMR